MKINDIVKYSRPQRGEESFRFRLLGLERGRADIELICNFRIKPIEVVAADEIEIARTEQSIESKVVDRLNALGVTASYEYPGYVNVPVSQTESWAFGTANETWMGDRVVDCVRITNADSINLEIPSTWAEVDYIANAIVEALKEKGAI